MDALVPAQTIRCTTTLPRPSHFAVGQIYARGTAAANPNLRFRVTSAGSKWVTGILYGYKGDATEHTPTRLRFNANRLRPTSTRGRGRWVYVSG